MSTYSSYRSRGSGYRGNTRGTHSYSSRSSSLPTLPPDRNITQGLRSTALQTLSKPRPGTSLGESPIKPENVRYVGSYNWVDETHPTIIVPGSPPEWRERPLPYRVPFDNDVRFIDQNGFRMGNASSCLLPLFRAVDIVSEENADTSIDWADVDILTDRNGLRKLLRWLRHSGEDGAEPLKDFRIDLQLGGRKTALLHRWEKRTREIAVPPRAGCGINFERESTTPASGCARSTGHHRIIQYDMGGLKMVVRFEVDACLPQAASSITRRSSQPASPRVATSTNVDSLTDMLSGLDVTSRATDRSAASPVSQSADIAVIRAGTQVQQSSLIELTTRSVKYIDEFDWAEQFPQLLLSATPHLFLAAHDRGSFQRIKKHELGTAEVRRVENSAQIQRAFRQLVEILRTVQALVKEHGRRGRLSLVGRNGTLQVFERTTEEGAVPDSELGRFGA